MNFTLLATKIPIDKCTIIGPATSFFIEKNEKLFFIHISLGMY